MKPFQCTWSSDWIQQYETPWGIIEKFRYANAVSANVILDLLGNKDLKQLKKISNAGNSHRNLITLIGVRPDITKKILGINLNEYNNSTLKTVFPILSHIKNLDNYFRNNVSYCKLCLSKGYHSYFHQIRFFSHCAFHPEQKINDTCLKCNKAMPKYLINKDSNEAFRCSCGNSFLDSQNIQEIFRTWKTDFSIQNDIVKRWLDISPQLTENYHLVFPLNNYRKYNEFNKNNIDDLSKVSKLFVTAFDEVENNSNKVIKISSGKRLASMKNDFIYLKEKYIHTFPHLLKPSTFKKKHEQDSFYFDIYHQTRAIYKSISRYLLRCVLKEHKNCVRIFNKANQNGDVCPQALAFVLWKMECEDKQNFSELERNWNISITYNFERFREEYSIFPKGNIISHIEEILEPYYLDSEIDYFSTYNISSINYIFSKIISCLLIKRFIKWLEIVKNSEKIKSNYPDDTFPLYIAKIPKDKDLEISFYFYENQFKRMKNIINDLNKNFNCHLKTKKYPSYKSSNRIFFNNFNHKKV